MEEELAPGHGVGVGVVVAAGRWSTMTAKIQLKPGVLSASSGVICAVAPVGNRAKGCPPSFHATLLPSNTKVE